MLHIRRATIDDAELLARLNAPVQQIHYEARPDLFKPPAVSAAMIADYRDRLADEQMYIFVGEVETVAIGYILAQIVERADNPYTYATRTLLVDQMSVNSEQRSSGYGEQLMQRVFDLAKSLDIKTVVLGVWAFNERAIAFYKRQGYVARDIRMEAHLEQL